MEMVSPGTAGIVPLVEHQMVLVDGDTATYYLDVVRLY